MLSSYRIQSNTINEWSKNASNTNIDNNSHREHDYKRPQMSSNESKRSQMIPMEIVKTLKSKNKNNSKTGSVPEIVENKEKYLDEFLHNNNLRMKLAMQNFSNDSTVRSDTVQDSKDFNSQSLTTQAKNGEQISSIMPAI